MKKLAPMVGSWKGEGSMRRGPGDPEKMLSTEEVSFELDGRILVVRGLHFDKADPKRVVHNAYAVASYNSESKSYRFRTYLANGREGDFEMKIEEGVIKWFMDSPRGKIVYSIKIEDGTWSEVGEMVGEGNQKVKFFEMELKKEK